MADWKAVVDIVTLLLVGFGGYALFLLKSGAEAAVKTTAEETAKARIARLEWQAKLDEELQKTRGIERQELRYQSYGALWATLRPLAIYDERAISRMTAGELSTTLSDWYFSTTGGLLLTPQARDFYFALQELLHRISRLPEDWQADRTPAAEGKEQSAFEDVLARHKVGLAAIGVLSYLSKGVFGDWHVRAAGLGGNWRMAIREVASRWVDLDPTERFATLQQAGSVLRACLTIDLESRLR
jgi:hypothetical protein